MNFCSAKIAIEKTFVIGNKNWYMDGKICSQAMDEKRMKKPYKYRRFYRCLTIITIVL